MVDARWKSYDGEDGPIEDGQILRTPEGEAIIYRAEGVWHFEVRGVETSEKYAKKIAQHLLGELKD